MSRGQGSCVGGAVGVLGSHGFPEDGPWGPAEPQRPGPPGSGPEVSGARVPRRRGGPDRPPRRCRSRRGTAGGQPARPDLGPEAGRSAPSGAGTGDFDARPASEVPRAQARRASHLPGDFAPSKGPAPGRAGESVVGGLGPAPVGRGRAEGAATVPWGRSRAWSRGPVAAGLPWTVADSCWPMCAADTSRCHCGLSVTLNFRLRRGGGSVGAASNRPRLPSYG